MLNIIAGSLSVGVTPSTSSYESIATVIVGGTAQSSIEFTSIPATYTHLQIRGISRDNRAVNYNTIQMQWNSDTGANYSTHLLRGDGSSVIADPSANSTSIDYPLEPGTGVTAQTFGVSICDILDYANTNKYKTSRWLNGVDNNGGGYVAFASGSWRNTAAITSIKLFPSSGASFTQYTQFALYGIKGS